MNQKQSGSWTIIDENNNILGVIELRYINRLRSSFNIFLSQQWNRKRGLGWEIARGLFKHITDKEWNIQVEATINRNNIASTYSNVNKNLRIKWRFLFIFSPQNPPMEIALGKGADQIFSRNSVLGMS